MPGGVDLEVV